MDDDTFPDNNSSCQVLFDSDCSNARTTGVFASNAWASATDNSGRDASTSATGTTRRPRATATAAAAI
jgi:hypothetical protein